MCCLWYPSPNVTGAIIIQRSSQNRVIKAIWSNKMFRLLIVKALIDMHKRDLIPQGQGVLRRLDWRIRLLSPPKERLWPKGTRKGCSDREGGQDTSIFDHRVDRSCLDHES